MPKTRRSGSKKKAKPATTENGIQEGVQQSETETLKEKPKKKKNRKPKKKINNEDDKENLVPHEDGSESTPKFKNADTAAEPKHSEINDENATKNSKKANGKKKKSLAAREPLSEVVNKEMEQGEYSIDYQSLHDALRDSFTLDDKRGPIFFAPQTNKTKNYHEKSVPKFSYSTSSTGDASRNSNTSSPSAKSKKLF